MDKRNIVLITFDSLRADHCSFMGYSRKTTPTLDRMARRGVYFKNAVASGVATPTSMFGVFTGTYPRATYDVDKLNAGDWRRELQKKVTIAQVLTRLGYMTGAVHANPAVSRYFGFNKGFSYFEDFMHLDNQKCLDFLLSKLKVKNLMRNISAMLYKKYTATEWKKLLPYIYNFVETSKNEKKPYFLWVLLLDTHIPYLPPKVNREWYKSSTLRLMYLNWKIRSRYLSSNNISEKDRELIINAYDDCIRYADSFVKQLWKDLKDDDPIFIIHADHGEGFGEHGFFYHPAELYEELIHVPLIVYNTDLCKGEVENVVSLKAMPATILYLIKRGENHFGTQTFFGDNEYVISKVFNGCNWIVAARSCMWKYIYRQGTCELYNLADDPLEQYNLARSRSDISFKMQKLIKKHMRHELEKSSIYNISKNLKNFR